MAQQKRLSKALNFWNTHITHIDSFLHSKDLGLSSSAMSFHTTVSSKNSFQKKSGFVGCFAAIPRVCPSDMHSQAMPHRRSRSNGICDRTLSTFYAEIRPGYNSWVGSIGILPFQAFQPSLSIINLGHFWHTGLEKLLHECFVKEQRSGQDMHFLKTTSMRKDEKGTSQYSVMSCPISLHVAEQDLEFVCWRRGLIASFLATRNPMISVGISGYPILLSDLIMYQSLRVAFKPCDFQPVCPVVTIIRPIIIYSVSISIPFQWRHGHSVAKLAPSP